MKLGRSSLETDEQLMCCRRREGQEGHTIQLQMMIVEKGSNPAVLHWLQPTEHRAMAKGNKGVK